MSRLLASLLLAWGVVSAQDITTIDPLQTYVTSNIVQPTTSTSGSTWVNGVYQDQLTCWAWGNPGYCGPNAIVGPNNNINFSFGITDLYQVQAIASVLPGSGSGLRVNGYNFGFTAKNGNGWDDGRVDRLSAYVHFTDQNNGVIYYKSYDLNYKFDWTTFNYSETFKSPYAAKDLKNVTYGFVGGDNNYWAGPYGPEVYNINFSLKYSVDPCATDPLSSPSCPGYLDAISKLLPSKTVAETTITIETLVVAPTSTATTTESLLAPTMPTAPVQTTSSATTGTTSTTTATSTSMPAPTTTAARESTSTSGGTAAGLAVIARNQQREQAIAAQAVQTATATAAAAAAASQQEAAAVAAQSVSASTGSSAVAAGPVQSVSGQGIRLNTVQPQSVQYGAVPTTSTAITAVQNGTNSTGLMFQQTQTAALQTETVVTLPVNPLLDRSNPLNEFLDPKVSIPQNTAPVNTGSTVNRSVADNEAAGSVSIATMAVAPTGYGDYLNFTLKDTAFYAPREVYRNQRTVDNARALRQLTNDSRHRDMVEQQYRR